MLFQKSRYRDTPLFAPDAQGNTVFPGLRARAIGPATPVIEHEVQVGDRLDHLARHYYNNDRAWWRLMDASAGFLYGDEVLDQANAGQALPVPKLKE
jgi:hypothetical protein